MYAYMLAVSGKVENISQKEFKHINVVVIWYDSKNEIISRQMSAIAPDPFYPGQVTQFNVLCVSKPDTKSFNIEFIYADGKSIPYRD